MAAINNTKHHTEKILLMTLPFLTPLIPPMGISCLKGYLEENGYRVKTVDVMSNMEIRELCYLYFDTLQGYIPEKKQGHFFNVGLDVLYNHFMAHVNYKDEQKYIALVKILVSQNFFVQVDDEKVRELNGIVGMFFSQLARYLIELFNREKPAVLGLSVYKGTLAASYFAARLIKEKFPGIKIVMGGTIFSQELYPGTPNFNYFLEKASFIDKIFIGESETIFLKYLRGELTDDKKVYTLKDIDDRLLDLNTVPLPDYSDFNLSSYPLLPGFTSRGCIYRCSFCAETVYWKRYNRKSAQKVTDEFEELIRKYGRRLFVLTDCMINPLVTPLSQEIIKRNLKVYWDVYIKIDRQVCDPDQTLLWRRGGFYRARLGIESGSQKVLDMIDKKITLQQIKDGLRSLASAGIKTTTYWIAGHPGETEEDFQQTLDLLEELQDSIFEAECDPFRYFHTGQVNAEEWLKQKGNRLLYPGEATDMLITQSYSLNAYPPREIIYDRQCRFKEKCKKLGIPNPYSIRDIMTADRRWQKIQPNAVPAIMDLNNNPEKYLGENENVIRIYAARNNQVEDVDFDF
ncbi:MAG: radical SAM protein [Candidatus Aminicenantes bacterium]|nr:MAG: radical SAM protein [Candidatus Aminicenantes bacterium]